MLSRSMLSHPVITSYVILYYEISCFYVILCYLIPTRGLREVRMYVCPLAF